MIKVVLFDFGGVLTEGGKAGSIHAIFARLLGIPATELHMEDIHVQLRSGDITTDEFFAELNRRHPDLAKVTPEQFKTAIDIFVKCKPVYATAAALREHGIRTAILSNVYELSVERLKRDGYYDNFDPLILSCEVHLSKPDVKMYELAIERLGNKPEEIVFIDDQERCLLPAQKLGMHTIWAVSPDQIVRDTKQLIQEQNGVTL